MLNDATESLVLGRSFVMLTQYSISQQDHFTNPTDPTAYLVTSGEVRFAALSKIVEGIRLGVN